jgi:hypothetical protein
MFDPFECSTKELRSTEGSGGGGQEIKRSGTEGYAQIKKMKLILPIKR